ncbi:hypothetical protein [Herbaspirillum sp. SJZ107]|uniref:hypothetical protein n=1 Tax=Herbaspirillum sp. SJZ107 TaxID=2572881 RepID=UPI0011538289|nr:hypothetical protein [Herbaspirillum sp. SJZ107]TQK03426.1 hypothetical protein FBX97_4992 [Herbaspirillum sp. SJZ107]
MNKRLFLNYSPDTLIRIRELVKHTLALHVHINHHEILQDDLTLEYELDVSMREWSFDRKGRSPTEHSPWAVKTANLILDSALRDHHIVTIKGIENKIEQLKISADRPLPNRDMPKLHSSSSFDHLDVLLQLGMQAQSQVRWLTLPRSSCEGLLLRPKGTELTYIPLSVGPYREVPFKEKQAYKIQEIFDYIADLRLL